MKLLVAIVNYGRSDLTIDCLRTAVPEVRAMIAAGDGCRIGLCENGSADDSARVLADTIGAEGWGDVVTLTAINPNRGFTGGNNAVIDPVIAGDDQPDYVLLLNNDTLVIDGAFRELVAFMDAHPDVGIGGARMEEPDGTPQRAALARARGVSLDRPARYWRDLLAESCLARGFTPPTVDNPALASTQEHRRDPSPAPAASGSAA